MELKTKYQYTYFIYPYLIEEKNYTNYLYSLLNNEKCKLKFFERKKDIEIDSYFMPEIKERMFWQLDLNREAIKSYNTMDLKMKANALSQKFCVFFEYSLNQDVPAKIGEEGGIFFDINKIQIICFNTGICFLLIKTALAENASFSDVLNFNYKFRDIGSEIGHTKEYENIKIQTQKLQNMQTFSEFLKKITGLNLKAKQINLDTNRLITYSYACLEQSSWNENTDIAVIEKEFEKFKNIMPAEEQLNSFGVQEKGCYKENYSYYGFTNNSTVLLTSACNIKNYTNLLFEYENEYLYHYIYIFYQKVYLKKLTYEFSKTKKFDNIKNEFLNYAKKEWIYEVTNDTKGIVIGHYFKEEQKLDESFNKLKNEYDLLHKNSEIEQTKKQNKWINIILIIMIIISLINIFARLHS